MGITKIAMSMINSYDRIIRVVDIILKMAEESPFMVIGLPNGKTAGLIAERLIRLGRFSPRDFSLNRWSDELVLVEQGIDIRGFVGA